MVELLALAQDAATQGAQATEWFSAREAGIWGGVMGAVFGAGFGGIGGGVGGPLAAMGKARGFVMSVFYLGIFCGFALLGVGAIALFGGQPWHVWLVFLQPGALMVLLFGALLPVLRKAYERAEQRKLDAASLRQA